MAEEMKTNRKKNANKKKKKEQDISDVASEGSSAHNGGGSDDDSLTSADAIDFLPGLEDTEAEDRNPEYSSPLPQSDRCPPALPELTASPFAVASALKSSSLMELSRSESSPTSGITPAKLSPPLHEAAVGKPADGLLMSSFCKLESTSVSADAEESGAATPPRPETGTVAGDRAKRKRK
jgi:hypothetical protein